MFTNDDEINNLEPDILSLIEKTRVIVIRNESTEICKYFGGRKRSKNGSCRLSVIDGYGVMFKIDELHKRFEINHGLFLDGTFIQGQIFE